MKYFCTLTDKRELMFFTANAYEEANYICGGFRYRELYTPCRNICIPREELRGYEQELYRELINREYRINQ